MEGVPVDISCGNGVSNSNCEISDAVAAVKDADITVLCLGTTAQNDEGPAVAHEGSDRGDFALPGSQQELASAVLAEGKPSILILVNGGIVAIDSLLPKVSAVVEAFFPALQAPTLARQLFGETNRVRRLTITSTHPAPKLPIRLTTYGVLVLVDAVGIIANHLLLQSAALAYGRYVYIYRCWTHIPLFQRGETTVRIRVWWAISRC